MVQVENKYIVLFIQVISIIAIGVANIDLLLKFALIVCYIFLFKQKKWHKHLVIMFVMLLFLAIASHGVLHTVSEV